VNNQVILILFFIFWFQEMDDHMRTMLHHRELEKLKGR
jgi:hypothetical protein